MKAKILFILHLPPPIHGAAMVGKYIQDSSNINNTFDCQYINLALAKSLDDIGKSSWRKLITFIKLLLKIRTTINQFQPDLCYLTPNAKGGAFYKDFLVMQLIKRMGCKTIVHYHNKGVSTRQNNILDNYLYKRFFTNTKVILLAQSLYNDFKKYVSISNLYICPNGIPQTPPLASISHKRFCILFLSNMMEEKGVWVLLKACNIIKNHQKDFECHFVGKWNDITTEEFQKRIKEYGLEKVVFAHGAQYGENKNKFWQQCDLFVFPTYYHNESFPMVLLEAMQQKKACISTNEGAIPEIIVPNETGYIIPKKSPEALAEKMEFLLEHPEHCIRMGKNGFSRYCNLYTLSAFETRLVTILKEAL